MLQQIRDILYGREINRVKTSELVNRVINPHVIEKQFDAVLKMTLQHALTRDSSKTLNGLLK